MIARRRWIEAGVLCSLATLVAACNSGGAHGDGAAVSAVQDPIIKDIPKPAGFTLVDKNSRATSSGRTRVAQVQYTGNMDRAKVKQFYEEYMPGAGFNLQHWSLDAGTFNLSFESDKEICIVRVSPSGLRTMLDVVLMPRPEGGAARETPGDGKPRSGARSKTAADRTPPP